MSHSLQLRPFREKDTSKAIHFAIVGMHFDWFSRSKLYLALLGRFFLYLELLGSTHILAAYDGDDLVGLLTAKVSGAKVTYHSFWKRLYVKLFSFFARFLSKKGPGEYATTNEAFLTRYSETHSPDVELSFLAADPDRVGQGIGSFLLNAFEQQVAGKNIYLFTDSACTWQFYEKRGYLREAEKVVSFNILGKESEISCFLYAKHIPEAPSITKSETKKDI